MSRPGVNLCVSYLAALSKTSVIHSASFRPRAARTLYVNTIKAIFYDFFCPARRALRG